MGVRKYKPTTPGRRGSSASDFKEVTRATPEKRLTRGISKKAGRNAYGRITMRHQGGGHKRQYRIIDFRRNKDGIPAKVAQIEYDPNRTARIALLHYADGEKRYILAPQGVSVGDRIMSGPTAEVRVIDDLSNGHLLARTQRDDLSEPERVAEVGRIAPRLTGPIGVLDDIRVLPD